MTTSGIPGSTLPTATAAETYLALRNLGDGAWETVQVPHGALMASAAGAASASLTPLIEGAAAGAVLATGWASLAAIAGSRVGQPASVAESDTGTHVDPVVGGTVANAGEYTWSAAPAGWRRVRDLPWIAIADAQAATAAELADVGAAARIVEAVASATQSRASLGYARAPIASLEPDRQGLLAPVTLGDMIVGGWDADGYWLGRRRDGGVRVPAVDGPAPLFGVLGSDGAFVGIDAAGRYHGDLSPAFAMMGRQPISPAAPHAAWALVDAGGYALRGLSHDGAPMDMLATASPAIRTEWLTAAGAVAAAGAAGARELIVAYMPSGERRVLTPWDAGWNWRCARLAYYGRSVRAWRAPVAGGPGEWRAVTIDGDGFSMPDDPDVLHVLFSDGQSLAQGSGGGADYPWRRSCFPDHTLTIDNEILPGDIRLGRDATSYAFALDPATLGDFTPIRPQTGVSAAHNLTPLETFLISAQARIVRKLGRPQRLCGFVLGAGGTQIVNLAEGTQNEVNLRAVLTHIAARAAARGWRMSVDGCLWVHAESDATTATATYKGIALTYRARTDMFVAGLTGQTSPVRWLLSQPSSTAEAADDELGEVGAMAFPELMREYPDLFRVAGAHYPWQPLYADLVHFTNAGYVRLGEHAQWAALGWLFGDAETPPLYPLSAVVDGAVITVTWSRPIVVDQIAAPPKPFYGVEISTGPNAFATIAAHIVNNDGSAVSVITLASPLGSLANARLQVGTAGQATPRTAADVPGTNLRGVDEIGRSDLDDAAYFAFALHDRIPLTGA